MTQPKFVMHITAELAESAQLLCMDMTLMLLYIQACKVCICWPLILMSCAGCSQRAVTAPPPHGLPCWLDMILESSSPLTMVPSPASAVFTSVEKPSKTWPIAHPKACRGMLPCQINLGCLFLPTCSGILSQLASRLVAHLSTFLPSD